MRRQVVAARVAPGEAERRKIVDHRIVLAPERHRAELAVAQARIGLIAELAASLAQRAVRDAEPVFDLEDGLVAAAQVLASQQTPVAAGHAAAARLNVGMTLRVVRVDQARVEQAVERDTRLRVRAMGGQPGNERGGGEPRGAAGVLHRVGAATVLVRHAIVCE
jgi:hypothetical protein